MSSKKTLTVIGLAEIITRVLEEEVPHPETAVIVGSLPNTQGKKRHLIRAAYTIQATLNDVPIRALAVSAGPEENEPFTFLRLGEILADVINDGDGDLLVCVVDPPLVGQNQSQTVLYFVMGVFSIRPEEDRGDVPTMFGFLIGTPDAEAEE